MVKAKELVGLDKKELEDKIVEMKQELSKEKSTIASGTRSENPGKIKKLRRDIARVLTELNKKEKK